MTRFFHQPGPSRLNDDRLSESTRPVRLECPVSSAHHTDPTESSGDQTDIKLPPRHPNAPLKQLSISDVSAALLERRWILRTEEKDAGALGAIYIADCAYGSKTKVAVKIPIVERGDAKSQFYQVGRVIREGRSLAAVQHPNLLRIRELIWVDDVPVLVLDHIAGESADRYFEINRRGTNPPDFTVDREKISDFLLVVEHVTLASGALHARNLVHRDIKPANVMVAIPKEMRPISGKLIDLGLAKDYSQPTSSAGLSREGEPLIINGGVETTVGQILGSFPYTSPEQIGGGRLDGRADIYSIGTMLYRFFCGRFPFSEGLSDLELTMAILSVEPPSPRQFAPQLPRHLERVIMTCLAKDPSQRFQTAGELADELRRARTTIAD